MKMIAGRILTAGLMIALLLLPVVKRSVAQDKPKEVSPSPALLNSGVKREELVARLERVIPQLMKEADVPGLSIALIRDAKVFWQHGFGVKNAGTKEPVNESTVFEAASLSKPVFAYAVLKMVGSGKLDLDTPLTKYLPGAYVEADERLNLITARRVLSHTTGFPNWRPRGQSLKIHFTPGERFSYSGEGFVYLQKVVEKLSGQPLDAFMKKNVFEPLGMSNSSYVWLDKYDATKATGHNPSGSATEKRRPTEANAAASLQTTTTDYAKFVMAMMLGTGLKKETVRQMLSQQVKVEEDCRNCIGRAPGRLSQRVAWGLGWGLQLAEDGDSFWHWGSNNDDVQCYIVGFEKRKTGVIVFTNSGNGLSIIPEIVQQAIGGTHPAFAWINHEPYNSPANLLLKAIMSDGTEVVLKRYRESRKTGSVADHLNEGQMNRVGYRLLEIKRFKEAIEVFKLNVEDFPKSSNVYDSLGEAYMASGEHELAIQNYQRSIELNPDNANAVEMLKKLRGK